MIVPFIRSPHHSPRNGTAIDTVVWHWTGGWRNAEDVARLDYQRTVNPVSAHFTIGRDGTIVQSVDLDRAAWHAGGGRFLPVDGRLPNMNWRSIGVEVCNRGFLRGNDWDRLKPGDIYTGPHRNPRARSREWERYTAEQIEAVVKLATMLEAEIPTLLYHTGHEDVLNLQHTKGAKLDPGPKFPWWALVWEGRSNVVRWDYDKRGWENG